MTGDTLWEVALICRIFGFQPAQVYDMAVEEFCVWRLAAELW